jgi:hypothetical protein
MPRFVILRHTLPAGSLRSSHFDLMLEDDGSLLTWALGELPSAEWQLAEQLPLHRLSYLDYEGTVSNNRGEVTQIVRGDFGWIQRTPDRLEVSLASSDFKGRLTIEHDYSLGWLVAYSGGS